MPTQSAVMLEPLHANLVDKGQWPPAIRDHHTSIIDTTELSSWPAFSLGRVIVKQEPPWPPPLQCEMQYGVHLRQPWPPPIHLEMKGDGVKLLRSIPWTSSSCYAIVVKPKKPLAAITVVKPKKPLAVIPYKFHHFKQWPRATSAQSIAVDSGLSLKAMSTIQFYMVPNLLATESLFSISLEHHSELHIFPDHVDSERFLLLYCGIEDDCVLKFSQFNIQDELAGGILSINILLVQKQQHFAND
ncbi:unnamed protein product [Miscanthus lutarioriparius]|uniref:Uncharacterized protein n=1 Tax=Miscanthus lutarioriparius TaxID=422564 RepID=A0A811RJB3_9POAL|nr:unnamed protein product [Miscanthus lutarioriparius]